MSNNLKELISIHNMMFVLFDMFETAYKSFDSEMRKQNGFGVTKAYNQKLKYMNVFVKDYFDSVRKMSIDQQEMFGADSDFYYELIMTAMDRCGDDEAIRKDVLDYIKSKESNLKLNFREVK